MDETAAILLSIAFSYSLQGKHKMWQAEQHKSQSVLQMLNKAPNPWRLWGDDIIPKFDPYLQDSIQYTRFLCFEMAI